MDTVTRTPKEQFDELVDALTNDPRSAAEIAKVPAFAWSYLAGQDDLGDVLDLVDALVDARLAQR